MSHAVPSPPRVGSAEIEAGRCRMGPSWARRGPVVGLSRLMAIICGPQVAQRRHGQGRRRSHPAGCRRLLCAEREHRRKIDLRHRLKPRSVARRRLRNCRYPKASRMRSSGIRPPSRAGYSSVQQFAPCPAQPRSFAPLSLLGLVRLVNNARYRGVPCRLSKYPRASH